jgi:HK97 family phage prohead protease
MTTDLLIEGYASLFGTPDLAGDVVRAGAFAASLRRGGPAPMLLQHVGGRIAGRWTKIVEDGKGLFVRGLVTTDTPSGRAAFALIETEGLNGLSIGFLARDWSPRAGGGRDLKVIELREISLVATPMAPQARFATLTRPQVRLAA